MKSFLPDTVTEMGKVSLLSVGTLNGIFILAILPYCTFLNDLIAIYTRPLHKFRFIAIRSTALSVSLQNI